MKSSFDSLIQYEALVRECSPDAKIFLVGNKADLIEKKHLKKYLEGIGITDRGLKKKAIEMRDSDVTRVDFDENCHLTYSTSGFSERPINLVIRKNILDDLSLGRFVITKEEVKAI